MTTTRCNRCGRVLTDPKSVARGYGPVCYKKLFGNGKKEKKQIHLDTQRLSPISEKKQILHRCGDCGVFWFNTERDSECFNCGSAKVREIMAAPEPPQLEGSYIFQYKQYDPHQLVGVIETFDGSMWWLFENTGNNVYYCFARLSGMENCAEFGYTNIDELWDAYPRSMIWYVKERDLPSCDYVRKEKEKECVEVIQ